AGAEGVGDARWHGHEAALAQGDRLAVRPDLERQLALEHVERVGMAVVDVGSGHALARGVRRSRDGEVPPCAEEADGVISPARDRLSVADRMPDAHGAGVSPWRRMISSTAARSGGPPLAAASTSATSRK